MRTRCGKMFVEGDEDMKEQILAVQRMQEYIELHLEQDVSMAELSKAAR